MQSVIYEGNAPVDEFEIDVPVGANAIGIEDISEKIKGKHRLLNKQILHRMPNENAFDLLGVYTEHNKSIIVPIYDNQIELKYRKVENIALVQQSLMGGNSSGRGKERTIEQAIFLVKQWNAIRITENVSQSEAAEIMGMSKKTLGEYNRHIKNGYKSGFKFVLHKNLPIGRLKKFNKSRK